MRVVCIGDSITYGEHVDPRKRWTTLLQQANPDALIINAGVCADTTRLGLERFPHDVQKHLPNVVVIQFGHNDANRWETDRGVFRVTPAAFEANLKEMIIRSRRFGAEHVLLVSPHPPRRDPDYKSDVELYANIVAGIVSERQTLTHYDAWRHFTAGGARATDWLHDGLHLSEAGHAVYARAIAPLLP